MEGPASRVTGVLEKAAQPELAQGMRPFVTVDSEPGISNGTVHVRDMAVYREQLAFGDSLVADVEILVEGVRSIMRSIESECFGEYGLGERFVAYRLNIHGIVAWEHGVGRDDFIPGLGKEMRLL